MTPTDLTANGIDRDKCFCVCPVCHNSFVPDHYKPRLQVREFHFCLCSRDCARLLLAEPEKYAAVGQSGIPCSESMCLLGSGSCPLLTR